MSENPHIGHRQRLKNRALTYGLSSLEPHEQIELLLCYAIPQGDLNLLAHELIRRFGSIAGICDADSEALMAVPGIGAHTASLLKLIPELAKAYLMAEAEPVKCYDTADKIKELLIRHYIGIDYESVTLLLFGGKMNLLAFEELHRGSISSAVVSVRTLIERTIAAKANCAVLAHNHPGGIAIPSGDDLSTTRQLAAALDMAGIPLLEHFIIAGNRATPILMQENHHDRMAALPAFDARSFYASPKTEMLT
ncbi:MAG: hypothetical protein IKD37_05060 [Clostridia bacterium]|nr:hypothetical protein [Clostridia bacterium]